MTASHTLAPVPKWYIADMVGKPLGGGYLATFSSLDHSSVKLVYQDPAGLEPWPYVTIPNVGRLGILFDENGSQGPFYFKFDTAAPEDLYYLEVYDADGVLQWTIDDFSPANAGGGSIVTSTVNINNQLINNVFWRNLLQNAPPLTPIAPGPFRVLAPGAHSGFSNNPANPLGFYTGPDIVFLKSNNNATDLISFPLFPLGVNALASDVTPLCHFNYTCSNVGAGGETLKCIQFPVVRNVQNLSNQPVFISFWAKSSGIVSTIQVQWFIFYGDGVASAPILPAVIQIFNIGPTWQRFTTPTTVPSAVGKTLGLCNNDALFLQFQFPLSVLSNIDFTKPTLYLGDVAPLVDFQTNDVIDTYINSPRTGNIKVSFDTIAELGYIQMDDGTIGQTGSGATTYGGSNVFPLYNLLYQNVIDAWAPVSGGRTGNVVNDFLAGKVMTLPKALGRAMAQAGTGAGLTAKALGQNFGVPNTVLPLHGHLANRASSPAVGTVNAWVANTSPTVVAADTNVIEAAGVSPINQNYQPSIFMNYFIKL